MASNVNPVEAEIVSPGRANNKPCSGVDPEYAQRYAVGNDGQNDNQSFLQRHLFKLCFALGWLFFPFWWFASLWGLKKRRHLRERPGERAAWIASIVLSLAGLIIFLVLIIYYGADPERARCKLAHRCKTESQVQQAQVQQAQEDPDTTLLTTLSVVYGGACDDALHKELVDSIQGSLNGIPNSDGNLLAYKGPCTSASPGRHLLQDQSTYDVNVRVKNSANEATRQGLAQQLDTMSTGGTNPPWCGEFCTNHQVQSTTSQPTGYKKCQDASYTCTSGTLIPGNILMGNASASDAACCTTCTAAICPAPATLRTSFDLASDQAPTFEVCCNACAKITCFLGAKSPPPPLSADTTPTEDLCCVLEKSVAPTFSMDLPVTGECNAATASGLASGFASGLDPTQQGTLDVKAECVDTVESLSYIVFDRVNLGRSSYEVWFGRPDVTGCHDWPLSEC